MNTIDAYMPYYGKEFESACKGYCKSLKWSYLSALWHYWGHTHCQGLPDDDEYLRSVCECDTDEWAKVRPIIFGLFFKLEEEVWHQKRMREIHDQANGIYKKRVGLIAKARSKNPNNRTDTSTDTSADFSTASKTKTKTSTEINTERGAQIAAPTLEDVKARAAMVGLGDSEAEEFWNHYEAIGWVNGNGLTILNWVAKLSAWKVQAQARAAKVSSGGGGTSSAQLTVYSKELDRIGEEIKTIRGRACQDAMGTYFYTESDKARLKVLSNRRKELKQLLGVTA